MGGEGKMKYVECPGWQVGVDIFGEASGTVQGQPDRERH